MLSGDWINSCQALRLENFYGNWQVIIDKITQSIPFSWVFEAQHCRSVFINKGIESNVPFLIQGTFIHFSVRFFSFFFFFAGKIDLCDSRKHFNLTNYKKLPNEA